MTSINYNVAATTALRTLQQTNSALEASQNRVSTGLKIGEAKDNAAYWSISTTLKSDNSAMSTVNDALGLGAATVDVAYQGLNKAKEVLDQIKSKLVSASQDGVDKAAVQSEINELQTQLKSIASSSSFSGENWLSVNSADTSVSANKNVVSSFTRDGSGTVSLGTIAIDTSTMKLVDASATSEGILDAGKFGNVAKGGISDILATASVVGTGATAAATIASTANTTGGTTPNKLVMSLTVNNETFTLEVPATGNDTAVTAANFTAALANNAALAAAVTLTVTGGDVTFTSKKTGSDTAVTIQNTNFVRGTGATGGNNTVTPGATAAGTNAVSTNLVAFDNTTNGITLDDNDTFSFSVSLDGGVKKQVILDKATVSAALGTKDGVISTVDNYVRVLNKALADSGLAGSVVAGKSGGNAITFTGGRTSVAISDSTASKGTNVLNIDITNATSNQITAYLKAVNTATDKVISAASTLGAVSSRIELQQTFVSNLMDTIDKGVSGLIDADLSEESTKLQALQTKQSLGIQALSIANSSTQNILSLFRS